VILEVLQRVIRTNTDNPGSMGLCAKRA
jgi:hypothetical protein